MELHASGEDYLAAILVLQAQDGAVRSIDLARFRGVSKPSVSRAVGVLSDGGFLTVDERGFLHLSEAGLRIAEKICGRRRFLASRFIELGIDPVRAEQDACRIGHAVSDEVFEKLKDVL
ncbi:MAG: metal-dependent transcriptional regulator [Treponemataceae bacterium]|nr:metal-dependent transcriptional regulator [Treponemataceae bacterium]